MAANISKKEIRAVVYARVSTNDQSEHGISLDAQRTKLDAYCCAKGWNVVERIVDAGESAKNLRRPGMQQLLRLVRQRAVDVVIVSKLDRAFRSSLDALATTQEFERHGIKFVSIQEDIDTTSTQGRLFFTMLAAMSEFERRVIGDRTREILAFKRAQGSRVGAVPFGYDEIEDGQLVPNEDEQRVIEKIREFRLRGYGYRRVASALNALGIRSKRGGNWHPKTVRGVVMLVESLPSAER